MTTQVPEPLPSYEWPPLPVTDLELAALLMAERIGAAFDDLEAERLRVLAGVGFLRKELVDAWLTEFEVALAGFTQRVGGEVVQYVSQHIGPRYAEAVSAVTGEPMSWTQTHLAALTSLATDTYGDFLQRAYQAQQVSQDFVTAVRRASAVELPKIAAGGRTARQAADRLEERLLQEYGIDHVRYRNGARVPVRQYARMAARTKSAVAYNAGTLNGCNAEGIMYVEVLDGVDCGFTSHEDPDKANGSVRKITDAARHAISHPNCVRSYGPRPDVTTDAEAEAARTLQPPEQLADQQEQAALKRSRQAQTRAAALRRARKQVQRQTRRTGEPLDVSEATRQALRAAGLTS